ncbi:tetratricopeptide repeat protein [Streptomyces sp. NPDC051985]|uniref:tetratricopeptide repeat protein n=1 Tax=Streptomyces sp. NPDC051985 TaxID=3155807 RepID=UPI0034341D74
MSRLSRETNETMREAQQTGEPAEPVEVRVTGGAATVDGVPLFPAPGEEPQQAVLNHLQRLARATGRPVLATVHDTRIGYVVRLQVNLDGASSFAGEPVRMTPSAEPRPAPGTVSPLEPRLASPAEPRTAPSVEPPERPRRDRPVHLLRPVGEPVAAEAAPAPAFPPRAVPEPPAPGTVLPPTGVFGPPPAMGGTPAPAVVPAQAGTGPAPAPWPDPRNAPAPRAEARTEPRTGAPRTDEPWTEPRVEPLTGPRTESRPEPLIEPLVAPHTAAESFRVLDPDPGPTPARGFDAVAEEVLGDEPVTVTVEGAALLSEPMARINEAVRAGRIEVAAELAERTVAEASAALGDGHTEVLHLGELTAYIAYLAGDPLRAFHLSLDLARQRRQTRDGEGAYGNVRSAATAWRAVRDPEHGLRLGHDLIALWTQLTTEDGPAAGDLDELESARARMGRLTERARRAAENA